MRRPAWLNRAMGLIGYEPKANIGHPAELLAMFDRQNMSLANIPVTQDSVMRISAAKACVRVIADALASLPLQIFMKADDGSRTAADDHDLADLIQRQPNYYMTSFRWRHYVATSLMMRGNSYNVKSVVRGKVDELLPVHPDRVKLKMSPSDGSISYEIRKDNGQVEEKQAAEVLHFRGLSTDGVSGRSIITDHRDTFGLAAAQEAFGAKAYANGGTKRIALTHPTELSEGAHKRIRESWAAQYGGVDNAGVPAILEEGITPHEISMTIEDMQYIASRKFEIEDIARIFGVPLHLIGELGRATNNNIEVQELEFVMHTIRPWCVNLEQEMNVFLLGEDRRHFIEHELAGFLRGDIKSRYNAYFQARQGGWLSVNDIRKLENMNPIGPKGDVYLQPVNMQEAGQEQIDTAAPAEPGGGAAPEPGKETPAEDAGEGLPEQPSRTRLVEAALAHRNGRRKP